MMHHKGTRQLNTSRLKLRPYQEGDAKQMFDHVCSDPLVTEHVNWATHENIKETEAFLQMHLQKYAEEDSRFYGWAVEMNGKIVGSIGAFDVDDDVKSCEIGYSLGSKFWGQGIATEAVAAVLEFLFNQVGFHRITASYNGKNIASGKVMQKVNMRYEGTLRGAALCKDGTYDDLVLHAILRSEYVKEN